MHSSWSAACNLISSTERPSYVVVTPLRKAASYEQRKTNLGNQNFRRRIIITKCHVLCSTNEGILVTVT